MTWTAHQVLLGNSPGQSGRLDNLIAQRVAIILFSRRLFSFGLDLTWFFKLSEANLCTHNIDIWLALELGKQNQNVDVKV